jgi:enoyl-CoA hydratase/carnithine racemase
MPHKFVLVHRENKIATLVLNRPEVMNAMNREMLIQLHDIVMQIAADESVNVVVLKGAGDHFSAGADVALFSEKIAPYDWLVAMKGVGQIVRTLREMPQPVVVMLKGVAVGGGANLALAGDFVVAAHDARFCEIFASIGLILDYGGTYLLPRLVGLARARELAMLADEIDGKRAADIGLVYKSVLQEELDKEVQTLADTLAAKPPLALRLIKEGLEKSFDMSLQQVLDWEAANQSVMLQTPEHKEIVKMFLEAKGKDS